MAKSDGQRAIIRAAAVFLAAAAFVFHSCSTGTEVADQVDMSSVPRQTGDSIFATQSLNGETTLRMEAARMEKYETDTSSYELFPSGFDVYTYKGSDIETHGCKGQGRKVGGLRRCRHNQFHQWAEDGNRYLVLGQIRTPYIHSLFCKNVLSSGIYAGIWNGE